MDTTQRGFIPLAVIVILGLTIIAGGTVAVISNKESKQKDSKEVLIQEQETQVSEQIEEDSSITADIETIQHPEGVLEEPEHQLERVAQELIIDEEVFSVCKEAKGVVIEIEVDDDLSEEPKGLQENRITARKSLIGQIQELCSDLISGDIDKEQQEVYEIKITEKWNIWEVASSNVARQQDDEE